MGLLIDDTEWADFVQFDRNVETTETLDDKVICSKQDDDDDGGGGVPLPTLSECQNYFKRIRDFALTQNNSELLADASKCQEKLEYQKLASANNQSKHQFMNFLSNIDIFIYPLHIFFFYFSFLYCN